LNEAHALARRRARCLALKFCSAVHRSKFVKNELKTGSGEPKS